MKIPLFVKALGIAIPVGATIVDCVGYVARVDGISMRPSLNPVPGQVDFVFLNKWAVRNYEISRGEIISLISPKNPDQRFIKRVVGLEGDVISTIGYKKNVLTIPPGHCWVEGDHVGSSLDSNTFGPVALGLVTAKATHIVWPPSRWCSLQNGITSQYGNSGVYILKQRQETKVIKAETHCVTKVTCSYKKDKMLNLKLNTMMEKIEPLEIEIHAQ